VAVASTESPALEPVAARARRRIMRRILPYIFFLYIIAFLDRVNVGYAALEMTRDLGFSSAVYGFGAGIFFFGYFLLEIPGCLIVEHWSARKWIARIMISWGVLAVIMGFIHTPTQFYVVRFLLGAAEAGFFPGIVVYLSHWFTPSDRAKTIALFMAAIPISSIIGAPVSGLLLDVHWLGINGWRWLFILEGAPAIVFGVVTILYLTDRPQKASWLSEDEKDWIVNELENEKQLKLARHSLSIFEAFRHREVLLLTAAYFLAVTGGYGFIFWLPTLVKNISGSSNLKVSLLSAVPYCFALAGMLFFGWSSDQTGERRWHTSVPLFLTAIGLILSVTVTNPMLTISMLCLAGIGVHSYLPSFWSLPTKFLTGSAAAACIGLINSVGNLGGFVGPYAVGYINTATSSFFGGICYLAFSSLAGGLLILTLREARGRAVVAPTAHFGVKTN